PDRTPRDETQVISPWDVGAASPTRARPVGSVVALAMGTAPRERVGGTPARGPFASRKVIVANTPCPGRTDVLLIATVRVRQPACVSGCATTFSFSVVSLPARSRATTVMTSGPADAFVESLKEPSGRTITLRPLMVSVAPTSVVPRTTTFAASTVASGWGSAIVSVGGVRSSVTEYDDVA